MRCTVGQGTLALVQHKALYGGMNGIPRFHVDGRAMWLFHVRQHPHGSDRPCCLQSIRLIYGIIHSYMVEKQLSHVMERAEVCNRLVARSVDPRQLSMRRKADPGHSLA